MQKTILATPKGAKVYADGQTGGIVYPPIAEWVPVDAKLARVAGPEGIGPRDFMERVDAFQRGEKVDLADGAQLRMSAQVGLEVNKEPYLSTFDDGHPTMANHATTAGGLVGDNGVEKLIYAAVRELSEEFIPGYSNFVGHWVSAETPVYKDWARGYAKDHNFTFCDRGGDLDIRLATSSMHGFVNVGDGKGDYPVLHTFEPTFSNEVIFTFRVDMPEGWWIADGEKVPGGKWRHSPVIHGKQIDEWPLLTTKAEIFVKACKVGLRRIQNPF